MRKKLKRNKGLMPFIFSFYFCFDYRLHKQREKEFG
nr:MAG TPA: hypothetical protein [Caudoviricetes sp.]